MDTSLFFYIAAAADNFARAAEKVPHLLGVEEMRGILTAAFNLEGAARESVAREQRKAELEGKAVDERKQQHLIVANAALKFVRERFSAVEEMQHGE